MRSAAVALLLVALSAAACVLGLPVGHVGGAPEIAEESKAGGAAADAVPELVQSASQSETDAGSAAVDPDAEIGLTWKEPVGDYELPDKVRPQSATLLLQYAVESDDEPKPMLRETAMLPTDDASQDEDIGGKYVEVRDAEELQGYVHTPQSVNLLQLSTSDDSDSAPTLQPPAADALGQSQHEDPPRDPENYGDMAGGLPTAAAQEQPANPQNEDTQEPNPPPDPSPPYDSNQAGETQHTEQPTEQPSPEPNPEPPYGVSELGKTHDAEAHQDGVNSPAADAGKTDLEAAAAPAPSGAAAEDSSSGGNAASSDVEMPEGDAGAKTEAAGVQEIEKLAKDGAISADKAAAEITDMLVQTSSEANPLSSDEKKLLGEVMLTMVRMDTMGDEEKARASESLVNVMTQPQFEIPLEQVLEKLGAHPFKAAA